MAAKINSQPFCAHNKLGLQQSNVEICLLKACFVKVQAMQGRYLPLPVVYQKDYDTAKRAFILYHQLYIARTLVYVILMLLPFFEVRLQIQSALGG